MTNLWKPLTLALLAVFAFGTAAEAQSGGRCVRLMRDPQATNRETLANACNVCMTAKVERRRPGNEMGTPTMLDFNLPAGSRQPLPFYGPGVTRIIGESPCPGN